MAQPLKRNNMTYTNRKQEITYKPGVVGRIARVVIPALKWLLPAAIFKWVYDKLYWLNKRRIWVLYATKSILTTPFQSRENKVKQSLTRQLLPYTMGGWKALENAFEVVARVKSMQVEGVFVECGVAQGGTAAMAALLRMTSIGVAAYSGRALQSLPYKAFEYMAYGLPILSSLNGELKEILEDEIIGKFYRPLDVDSFCRELNWLLENSDIRTEMGRRAKKLFDDKYSTNVIYPNMVSYIEGFLPN